MARHKWVGHDEKEGLSQVMRGAKSVEGKLCGFVDCLVPPEQTCYACKLWYCTRHFQPHFMKYPEHKDGGEVSDS